MKRITMIFASLLMLVAWGGKVQAQCGAGQSSCEITVIATDDSYYYEGWNGWTVDVYQGSTFRGSITVEEDEGENEMQVTICAGVGADEVYFIANGSSASGDFSYYDYLLSLINNEGDYVLKEASFGSYYDPVADGDTLFTYTPVCATCLKPVLLSAVPTASSITVSINEKGDATQWLYAIAPYGEEPTTWTSASITTYTFENLDANTLYEVMVRSYCGAGDTSATVSTMVATDYTHITSLDQLPIFEDFDGNYGTDYIKAAVPFRAVQYGYYYSSYSGSYTYYPYIYTDSYGVDGSNCLYMYPGNGRNAIATPWIEVDAASLELVFWASGGSSPLEVGYCTAADCSDFTLLQSINVTSTLSPYIVSLSDVATNEPFRVLIRTKASGYNSFYIDNVELRKALSCPQYLGNITWHSEIIESGYVKLSWGALPNVNTWEVAYGAVGFDPDDPDQATYVSTDETMVELYTLDDTVTYQFYVRSDCGDEKGYWSISPVVASPLVYLVNGYNVQVDGCDFLVYDNGYLNDQLGTNQTYTATLVSSEDKKAIHLEGFVNMSSNTTYYGSYYHYVNIYDGTGSSGELLATYVGDTLISIDSKSSSLTIEFHEDSYYKGEGFKFAVSCIDMLNCFSVVGPEATVSGNSVDISWNYPSSADDPEGFTLQLTNTDNGTVLSPITVSGDLREYTVAGLDDRTNYSVSISTLCDDDVDPVEIIFRTNCANGGDIYIGDEYSTSSNNCSPAYVSTYMPYSLSQSIYLTSELEEVEGTIEGFNYLVESIGYGGTTSSVDVDIRVYLQYVDESEFENYGPFIAVDTTTLVYAGTYTFQPGANYIPFSTPFTYDGSSNLLLSIHTMSTGDYIYTKATNTSSYLSAYCYGQYDYTIYNYGDVDITNPYSYNYNGIYTTNRGNIEFVTPCGDPTCVKVSALKVTDITTSTAEVSWQGAEGDKWNVKYRVRGADDWTTVVTGTTQTNVSLSGLESGTDYEVAVFTQCTDKDAQRKVVFTTECGTIAAGFFEDFEHINISRDQYEVANCWDRFASPSDYAFLPYVSNYSYNSYNLGAFDGQFYLYFYNSYTDNAIITPAFSDDLKDLEVSFFMASPYPDEGAVKIEVGVAEEPLSLSNLVPIDTLVVPANVSGYQFVAATFENYTGTGNRIYLRSVVDGETYEYGSVYVDALSVDYIPACSRISSASVIDAGESTAIIQVEDPLNRTSFRVLCDTLYNKATATEATATYADGKVTVTGLQGNTTYHFWVMANCGDGDYSPAFYAGTALTNCSPVVVTESNDFFCDFEARDFYECIRIRQLPGSSFSASISNDMSVSPNYSLLCYAPYTDQQPDQRLGEVVVLPPFNFSGLDEMAELSFSVRYNHNSTSYVDVSNLHVEPIYRTSEDGEWISITVVDSTNFSNWNKYFIDLPASQGAAYYQVGLRVTDPAYGDYVYIDDVRVGSQTNCRPPIVSISGLNEHEVTVSWEDDGIARHRVQYRRKSSFGWTGIIVEDATSTTIAPLFPNVEYQVRVQSLCDDEAETDYSPIINFTTPNCSSAKYYNNFSDSQEAITDATFLLANYEQSYVYNYVEVLLDASKLAGVNTIDALLFQTDGVANRGVDDVTIYLTHTNHTELGTAVHYNSNSVKVFSGTLMALNNGWNQVALNTPFEWNGDSNIVVGIRSYTGYTSANNVYPNFTGHVAATNMQSCYTSTSNFTVKMLAKAQMTPTTDVLDVRVMSCDPQCFAPTLRRITTTQESATIDWIAEGGKVVVEIREEGSSNWGEPKVVSGEHKVTFDQLSSSTNFEVRLRRDCSESGLEYSEPTYGFFTTDTACSYADELKVVDVTATTATLTWTYGPIANLWEVRVWNNSGFEIDTTVSGSPAVIKGLLPSGSYSAQVRSYCGSKDHVVGEWSEVRTFQNSCAMPTGVTATALNGNKVRVEWAGNASRYVVSWGLKGNVMNEQLGYDTVTTTTYTINDLKNGFVYSVRVRAICDDNWNSAWTDAKNVDLQGIDDVEGADTHIALQPNPATDRVQISLDGLNGEAVVSIVSVDGRQVAEFSTTESSVRLSLNSYAAGTYFVRVKTADWSAVRKLIVK